MDLSTICEHSYVYRKLSISKIPKYSFPHTFIKIPHNLGRETTVYLQHFIIDNYDNLPNDLFFSQARPLEHWPYGIINLNGMLSLGIKYELSYLPITSSFGLETYESLIGFNIISND